MDCMGRNFIARLDTNFNAFNASDDFCCHFFSDTAGVIMLGAMLQIAFFPSYMSLVSLHVMKRRAESEAYTFKKKGDYQFGVRSASALVEATSHDIVTKHRTKKRMSIINEMDMNTKKEKLHNSNSYRIVRRVLSIFECSFK